MSLSSGKTSTATTDTSNDLPPEVAQAPAEESLNSPARRFFFGGPSIAGLPPVIFIITAAIIVITAVTGNLPNTMIVGFSVSMVFGGLLMWIGKLVPVIRDFGLPTILCTFLPAILMFVGVMSKQITEVVTSFVNDAGFLDFFVVSVICGTILGMPRKLLMKAGPRFFVPLLGALVATFGIIGAVGAAMGKGFIDSILLIAAPVMSGGLGIGAVPMSNMYAEKLGTTSDAFMGDLMSAVVLANVACVLVAGFYQFLTNRKVQWFVGFNGNGELMRVKGPKQDLTAKPPVTRSSFAVLMAGLLLAGVLFIAGSLLGALMPIVHPYAWTIVLAALVKICKLMPKGLEESCSAWGDMLTAGLVPALLVGVSISFIDIGDVIHSVTSPVFVILTLLTVMVSGIVSGAIGWCMKFNFIESSLTPGLVMTDTGGSGDVAVLSAAGRMHLMPFAALTNRIGGAVVLFVTSLLVPFM